MTFRFVALICAGVAACAPQPKAPPPAPPKAEAAKPFVPVPQPVASLAGWAEDDHTAALATFRKSCAAVQRRNDMSGLTKGEDWAEACMAAATATDAKTFFETYFVAVPNGPDPGMHTGYYEPDLNGARTPGGKNVVPLYRRPPELVEVELNRFREALKGQRVAGRVENGQLVPFANRAQIEGGALAGRGLELVYVDDWIDAFFLHVQGSGRVNLADGSVIHVGYDGQNGHQYVSLGRVMLDKGLLPKGGANMQAIRAWGLANPEQMRTLMQENPSFIFFRELPGGGPNGSMGVALTPERSIAVDQTVVPLGAPVWLEGRHPDPANTTADISWRRLMVAQDIGGAIRGRNRADVFWGAGAKATLVAGHMAEPGRLFVLLPKAAAARLPQP
jgi:membrane-bound lytic murein transglycosylase A